MNVFGVKKKKREDNSEAIIEILVKNFSKLTGNLKLQILLYWLIYRHIDQWNKTESPEKRSYIYIQLMFDKGAKTIHWGKRIVFKINGGPPWWRSG